MNSLQFQIKKRLEDKNLSARALEIQAGLSNGVVHNILSGKAKNPTIKTLDSISRILGCSPDDLFNKETPEEVFHSTIPKQTYDWNPDIFFQAYSVVKDYINNHNLPLPARKVFDIIWALYTLSLSKNSKTVDKDLCDWVFNQILD